MKRLTIATLLLATLCLSATADPYVDPHGLPSGTATLAWFTRDDLMAGADVHAFDFATGAVDSLHGYDTVSEDGAADLVLIEIVADPGGMSLGAPEGGASLDKLRIKSLGAGWPLEEILNIGHENVDSLGLVAFEPAVLDDSYIVMQVSAADDTTWAKLRVTEITATDATFDWVWQPNGDKTFTPPPPAAEPRTLSLIKSLYR